MERGATESSTTKETINGSAVETGLLLRKAATVKTLKCLVQAIDLQRVKNEELASSLRKGLPPDGELCSVSMTRTCVQ